MSYNKSNIERSKEFKQIIKNYQISKKKNIQKITNFSEIIEQRNRDLGFTNMDYDYAEQYTIIYNNIEYPKRKRLPIKNSLQFKNYFDEVNEISSSIKNYSKLSNKIKGNKEIKSDTPQDISFKLDKSSFTASQNNFYDRTHNSNSFNLLKLSKNYFKF